MEDNEKQDFESFFEEYGRAFFIADLILASTEDNPNKAMNILAHIVATIHDHFELDEEDVRTFFFHVRNLREVYDESSKHENGTA